MSPDPRPEPRIRLPLLGRRGDPLRFELELQEDAVLESAEDPFVPLSEGGRLARVLLGRLVSGDGSVLKPLAVKIQRSVYRPLAGGKDALTNPRIEERWRRERDALLKCGGGALVPAVDFGEDQVRSAPVTFCRRTKAYFHPPCPRCGEPLRDCRDDALLEAHGLPAFSRSKSRYLHCGPCGSKDRKVFYTAAPVPEETVRGDAEVRRRTELYRDLGQRVNAMLPAEDWESAAKSFPCMGCPHRETCYPLPGESPAGKSIPAEALLHPVSYYDFHLLAFEVMELHYDEFTDLLGGADWTRFREKSRQSGSPGRERTLAAVDAHFGGPRQWLCQDDAIERYALEILHLKLAGFTQLCRAVRDYHAQVREPHLHLAPPAIMVDVLPGATNLPARWSFQVRLLGGSGPHRFEPEGLRAGTGLPVPATDADPVFLSPFVRGAEAAREETMRISIRTIQADGDAVKVEGVASSERARLAAWQPGDLLRIAPSGGSLEGLLLWASVEWREDTGVKFSARVPSGGPLDPERKPADFDAGVSCTPRFGPACDLYSLGMLFFRTLLVNDGTSLGAMDDAVQRVLRRVAVWSEGRSPAASKVAAELAAQAAREAGVFSSPAVMHDEEDRDAAPKPVPARIWSDLLVFGFRLATAIPGFSFASSHADGPAERPEALLEAVLAELALLEARVRIELFGRAERDRELSEACAEVLAELAGGGPGAKP